MSDNEYDINNGLTLEEVEKIKDNYAKAVAKLAQYIALIDFGVIPSETSFDEWCAKHQDGSQNK